MSMRVLLLALLVSVISIAPSWASVIGAVDIGHYSDDGSHDPSSQFIFTGFDDPDFYNNFFVFDLSSAAGQTVSSATLTITPPGSWFSSDLQETYEVFDFTGSISDLVAGSGGVAAFNDLGSGVSYGSAIIDTSSSMFGGSMPTVDIALSGAAISDLNALIAASLFDFAIGGSCVSCEAVANIQGLWTGTGGLTNVELSLDFAPVSEVPIPAALPLFMAGLAGLRLVQRKRKQKSVSA